jgi:hypothetical protein
VRIKRRAQDNEVYILCLSEGREAKDRAIQERHELRLKEDLQARIEFGGYQRYKEECREAPVTRFGIKPSNSLTLVVVSACTARRGAAGLLYPGPAGS